MTINPKYDKEHKRLKDLEIVMDYLSYSYKHMKGNPSLYNDWQIKTAKMIMDWSINEYKDLKSILGL